VVCCNALSVKSIGYQPAIKGKESEWRGKWYFTGKEPTDE